MATLQSSWSITAAAGQPHSIIRVQNLQTSARVGSDAWGRAEKLQPVLISASVSLREPFINASVEDTVNKSTIHYGILSKAILEAVSSFRGSSSLALSDHVFRHLLKLKPNQDTSQAATNPTVDSRLVRSLNIEIVLPKGTLLGNGVSFSETILFGGDGEHEAYSRTTKIRDLRIPTLIGVNSNERLAKQIVVANVEIDRWDTQLDYYVQLDQIVVKTIEESSFETLEALAMHLGHRIIQYFIITGMGKTSLKPNQYPLIRISLAKPSAVMFADAPVIEILLDSGPDVSAFIKSLWQTRQHIKAPPFPLEGRLDEWIEAIENHATNSI